MELFKKKNVLGGDLAVSAGFAKEAGGRSDPLALLGYYRKIGKNSPIRAGLRAGAMFDIDDKKLRPYIGIGASISFK